MADVPTIRIDRSLRRSLTAFREDRLAYLDRAAALGPLAGLRFGPATVFVVTDGVLARRVLVTDQAWSRPPAQRVPVSLAVGENLFSQSDRAWARVQPTIAPAFRSRALVEPLTGLDAIVGEQVDVVPRDETVDLEELSARIALAAAAWVMLGDRPDDATLTNLIAHQRHVVDWVGHRLGALDGAIPLALGGDARRMRVHRAALERYVDGVIDRATRTGSAAGVLAAVLAATRAERRPDAARRGHVLGLLLAGNETTAAALAWILVHASANPAEWARLRREPGRTPDFVAESLRLSPPAWGVTRTPSARPVVLAAGGVSARVRRPGVVTVYLRGIQRSPQLWSDPLRFDPDRHAGTSREHERNLIPFGLGPRGCVGQHLALAELHAVVPALAQHGDVVVDGPVAESADFALRPRGGLRGRFVAPGASGQ